MKEQVGAFRILHGIKKIFMTGLLANIETDYTVMLGKPVIKGTRITVELILRKISGGYSFENILEMYQIGRAHV